METIIRLKASEIDLSFLSAAEMWSRIDKSIEDAEKGSNLISFTEVRFEVFAKSSIEQ